VLKLQKLRELKVKFQGSSLSRSFLAVSDQGVISLGNFFTGILLARHFPQAEYGIYALIIGILISANSLHASLISYPLSVQGAQTDAKGLGQLATGSLLLTVGLSLFLNLGVFTALWVLHRPDLAMGVFGVSLLWQFQEILRKGLLSQMRQGEALWGDGLSYLGQAVLIWFLIQEKWLTLDVVFITMMLTSGLAALLQAIQLGLQSVSLEMVINFAKKFWIFGRWILLTNVMTVLIIQIFPWSLKLFHGPEATASFQVIVNILGVSNPVIFSLGGLIIPAVTQTSMEGKREEVWRTAWKYALPFGSLLLIYYVVLLVWPREILAVFYGSNSPYLFLGLETPLRILVLSFALMYCSIVFQSLLYGLEDSRAVFLVQLLSTGVGLILGIPLVIFSEVLGACIATFLVQLITLVTLAGFIRKKKIWV
jgi:O-antigen/teichoic acid export membrane protein